MWVLGMFGRRPCNRDELEVGSVSELAVCGFLACSAEDLAIEALHGIWV